jgi:hypothetical protein
MEEMVKSYWAMSIALLAAVSVFGAAESQAAAGNPNLAGKFQCGPDMKVCQWSGKTFTISLAGNHLDIKNDKGDEGTATVTSAISVSAGPPWNMLGVISGDGKTISWSNGSEWKKT